MSEHGKNGSSRILFLVSLFVFWVPILPCHGAQTFRFDPAPLLEQAAIYLDQGKFLECVEAYDQVVRYASGVDQQAHALVRMGDVLSLFLEQKEQALAIYTQAMERFGPLEATENAYFNRAMILYEQGRLAAAREGFTAYATLFPQGVRTGTALFMVDQIDGELQTPEGGDESAPVVEEPAATDRFIRVALASESTLRVQAKGGGRLIAGGSRRDLAGESVECRVSGGKLLCNGVGSGSSFTLEPLQGIFTFNGRAYQGQAVMMVDQGKVLLVNRLPVEAYLQGVVPREMMASWDDEALCSQAVAARTYALYLSGKSEDKPYDVAATTASQVYGGAEAATRKTDQAVARTAGQVLVFEGRPVLSYFHSHSGGMLEDPAKVWTTSMPYYKIKNDRISQQFHPVDWSARIMADEVQKALIQNGFHVGPVRDMRIVETSPSGRWTRVAIITDTGEVEVKGNSLRIWLGAGRIKSTFGTLTRQGDAFVFKGQGFGHGVGLSQWGAQGMARAGNSYQEILTHYYPGTTISKIY